MIIKVKAQDLRVGMYVQLPKKWFSHPFLKNEFLINSTAQIAKMIEIGLTDIAVDTQKSNYEENPVNAAKTVQPKQSPKSLPPILPPDLQEAIHDKKLAPQEKAQAVHQHSVVMIHRLMDAPTTENIREAKKGVAEIVDMILADDKTNQHLLNITSHDYSTYVHSVNVGLLGVSLSKALFKKSHAHNMHELGAGFFLHDLGKVKININIINKPAVLTDEEIREMRLHPQLGYEMLNETHQMTEECKKIVLQHHERYDGAGYPLRLKGDDIHIYGRICSLADVYDALNSDRPYRAGIRSFEALNVMKVEMLAHFQKDLFEQFVLLFK